uniref:Putative TSL-kinase interacting protein 1 isoform X1 n=1 Tax=Davidia involucrata TaxID=16924 RepID=A0A5B7BVJ8_DAVIN
MKTTGQRKVKTVEAPKRQNASAGSSGVKKSRNRNSGWLQKAKGVLPATTVQVLGKQLPNKGTSFREMTKIVPALDLKTGQLHPSVKIKLQLFPIDEGTFIGLEKDGHNPFLELTLRARKKISSVLKHLNSKWGSSSVAQGELMLFPYNVQLEKLASYRKWNSNDSSVSAGDVYAAIGSPAIFRLRYGWFSTLDLKTFGLPFTSTPLEACLESEGIQKGCTTISEIMYDRKKKLEVTSEEFKPIDMSEAAVIAEQRSLDIAADRMDDEVKIDNGLAQSIVPWDDGLTNLSIGGLLSEASLLGKIHNCDPKSNGSTLYLQPIQLIPDISVGGLLSEASFQGKINNYDSKSNGSKLGLHPTMDKDPAQSPLPWDDSLTTLSIGGLLSEASLQGKINNCDPKSNGSKTGLQSTLLISDSFDAFIAGQINSHPHVSKPSSHESHSSILDAEETCHAFPFRKFSSSGKDVVTLSGSANSRGCSHDDSSKPFKFPNFAEFNRQAGLAQDPPCWESNTDLLPHSQVYNDESSFGLTGIKWTDSLGPFDLGLSTSQQINSRDGISISEFVR